MKINFSSYPFFIEMVLAQLAVPVFMIIRYQTTIGAGHEFRFRTAPIDPEDPFRGKYVTLSYEAVTFVTSEGNDYEDGQEVFVSIKNDSANFAMIAGVSNEEPSGGDYVTATIRHFWSNDSTQLRLSYPFDHYFMEESLAPKAEGIFNEANRERTEDTYALVSVYRGKVVVKDVFIGDVSIKQLAKESGD